MANDAWNKLKRMEKMPKKGFEINSITIFLFISLFSTWNANAQPRDSLLVWSDEFNIPGMPDSTKWNYEQGYVRNNELQYFTVARKENARVENGSLVIEARNDHWNGNAITSASLTTNRLAEWQYGRFDVRARFATIKGSWPAIWLLAENSRYGGWPMGGEIDIMENVGFEPTKVHGTVHVRGFDPVKHTGVGKYYNIANLASTWHVYSTIWTPDSIFIQADGITYMRYGNQHSWQMWPFDQEFFLMLGLSIGGEWGGQQGVDSASLPIKLEVDYARVYKMKLNAESFTLATTVSGQGHIENSKVENTYTALTPLTLTAIPDPGWTFIQWSNGSIKYKLNVVMDHNVQLEALFLPTNELLLQSTFPYGLGKWFFWHDANLTATQTIIQDEVCIDIANSPGQDWQAQFDYPVLKVIAGEEYDLTFSAHAKKVDRPVKISFVSKKTSLTLGPTWDAAIGTVPQIYTHRFTISASDSTALLLFSVGQDTSQICMSQFSLKRTSVSFITRKQVSSKRFGARSSLVLSQRGIFVEQRNLSEAKTVRYNLMGSTF